MASRKRWTSSSSSSNRRESDEDVDVMSMCKPFFALSFVSVVVILTRYNTTLVSKHPHPYTVVSD